LLPERQSDIHFLNYGIPLFKNYHVKQNSTLNLIFLGRHDIQKGIYDLFEIEEILQKNNVLVNWTILGKGPETESIKLQWNKKNNVFFHLAKNSSEVLHIASEQDVLVFPTRFEGSPVAMLEAMSVGCVPVVTSLSGGINETIKNGVNGFLCELGSIHEFAEKIILLANNRQLLKDMQNNAFVTIEQSFNPYLNFKKYQDVFNELNLENTKPLHQNTSKKIGSRLDAKFIPNWLTTALRKI
jgi:glycosyltransferase involved in cell wall biosynthesis